MTIDTYIAPLYRFEATGGTVGLGSGLEIGALSEDERKRCEDIGIGRRLANCCIRFTPASPNLDGFSFIHWVVVALRLHKAGSFGAPLVLAPDGALYAPEDQQIPLPRHHGGPYALDVSESQEVANLLLAVVRANQPKSLPYALLSFSKAASRMEAADALVDMMIAAEAAFLGVSDELSFRLSLRVASLLETEPEEREELRLRIKRHYDLRSRIVHGTLTQKDRDALPAAASDFENVMRRALRIAVEQGLPKDLDRLIFAGTRTNS